MKPLNKYIFKTLTPDFCIWCRIELVCKSDIISYIFSLQRVYIMERPGFLLPASHRCLSTLPVLCRTEFTGVRAADGALRHLALTSLTPGQVGAPGRADMVGDLFCCNAWWHWIPAVEKDSLRLSKTNACFYFNKKEASLTLPTDCQHQGQGLILPCQGLLHCLSKSQRGKWSSEDDSLCKTIHLILLPFKDNGE